MTVSALPKEVAEYFPYKVVRPFQDQYISTIHSAVKERRSVLIEGSNGLGKTISALSAVLPIAIEKKLKVLYVARTHRQHERVIEELKAVSKNHPVAGVSLRGRNEMCLYRFDSSQHYDAKSLMEVCDLMKAKGTCPYYKSAEKQSYDYLALQQQIGSRSYKASEIMRICKKKNLCPYELVKAALSDVNVIALSYLYVFDPDIRNAFLKNLDTQMHKIILVVDEAHNLPDTAVDISSSNLSLFMMHQAEMEAKKFGYEDVEAFAKLLYKETEKRVASVRKEEQISPLFLDEVREKAGVLAPRSFYQHLNEIGTSVKKTLLSEGKHPRSYIHSLSEFLLRWTETADDEAYINVISKYFTRDNSQTAKLEIVALDPSKVTLPVFSSTYANVVMSGTLQPLDAYAKITKMPENTVEHIACSPFPREHILSVVCCGVTTAMEYRTSAMYQTFIRRIQEVVRNTPVNTGIFTASYEVTRNLLAEGLQDALEKPLYYERRGMTSKANEKLVSDFKDSALTGGAVFLGVQGGRTSEGVDFPGNQMNSVIIIGVPYAEPTPRVKAQISYFEKRFPTHGREYGYTLPAMKKASQCAGRPVRTLDDQGAIVFLDHRFATGYCKGFLPSWVLRDMKVLPAKDGVLAQELQGFFKR
ncbi:MAG: DEAD/DEAH box helicase family protein [Candidatus Bathyarchaeota archaeon]|nr:DEAD/DEAH box helicase family protein [Candidatus Bathyarchaeota archaeon]